MSLLFAKHLVRFRQAMYLASLKLYLRLSDTEHPEYECPKILRDPNPPKRLDSVFFSLDAGYFIFFGYRS